MRTIQINTCTQEELEWLPGVGAKTAEKIIKARPIEAKTDLERLVPPSAWLKIQDADVEFAFGMDGEEPAEAPPAEPVVVKAPPELRITLLQEPEPLTLRRVLPGQPLKTGVGAEYLCVWNIRWGPDGAAYHPRDEPVQVEIEETLKAYDISIQYAHYQASVRVKTNSYGPIPVVLFEIVKEDKLKSNVEAIYEFVKRVNARAEANMEKTGKLEGAHYAAMQVELAALEKTEEINNVKAETEGDRQGNGERD